MFNRTEVPTIHLVCNAHIDPVWQWEWEEGASSTLATFKVAADLCEEFPAFIFNHNEAVLYKWIEEYDPLVLNGGKVTGRMSAIGREAESANESPFAINIFPTGSNRKHRLKTGLQVSDPTVLVPACKRAENGKRWLVRLFEPTGTARRVKLVWSAIRLNQTVTLQPFELLTLTVDPRTGKGQAADLIERTIG